MTGERGRPAMNMPTVANRFTVPEMRGYAYAVQSWRDHGVATILVDRREEALREFQVAVAWGRACRVVQNVFVHTENVLRVIAAFPGRKA